MSSKTLIAGAAASLLIFGMAGTADAIQATPIPTAQGAPEVTLVAGGCGIGFHRGPYGGCRPNFGWRGGWGPGWRGGWGWRRGWGWHRGWRRW